MTTWSLFATDPMTSGDNDGWSEALLTSRRNPTYLTRPEVDI